MLYSRITHKPTVLLTHPNHLEILFPHSVSDIAAAMTSNKTFEVHYLKINL